MILGGILLNLSLGALLCWIATFVILTYVLANIMSNDINDWITAFSTLLGVFLVIALWVGYICGHWL